MSKSYKKSQANQIKFESVWKRVRNKNLFPERIIYKIFETNSFSFQGDD